MPEPTLEAPLPLDPGAPTAATPRVIMGRTCRGGIAPSIFALVERGVLKRPHVAVDLRGLVALRFRDGFPPVSISFEDRLIRVDDMEATRPDVIVSAQLDDVVLLTTAPLRMGMPSPTDPRGRAVLGKMATGQIRIRGDRRLARGMLELMRIEVPHGATEKPHVPGPDSSELPVWIDVLT